MKLKIQHKWHFNMHSKTVILNYNISQYACFTEFWSNRCSLGEHMRLLSKTLQNDHWPQTFVFPIQKLHFLFIFLRMNLLEEENIRLQQTTAQMSEHIECLTILAETNCSVSSTLKQEHWFKSNWHVNRGWMQFNEFCSHTVGSHCESRHRGRRPSYSTYINLLFFSL